MKVDTVVFDIGGVLIDWDPRHLFTKLIADQRALDKFLTEICTIEWHSQHDLGRPFNATIPPLVEAYPAWEDEIRAWGDRFSEMWGGQFDETVAILEELRKRAVPLYAATNWGAESWVLAKDLFPCLRGFDGELVSGEVGLVKPDPRFFDLLVERFGIHPSSTLYVDDNLDNVATATSRGFVCHHFVEPALLVDEISRLGLLDIGVRAR
jgi:2-haloacid dehalogenase